MHRLLAVLLFIAFHQQGKAQFGTLPPFELEIEAISGVNLPGLHSFAFAQSGDKWLFVGGRINGLHGLNVNDGFLIQFANNFIAVIDTSTWSVYASTLDQLPYSVADPLRSTNMQYHQDGDYLYMIGGYGMDSSMLVNTSFPVLSAIHVNNMIQAVMTNSSIAPHIRQYTDTLLAVCGGELEKIGDYYHLFFGHFFEGRYSEDAGSPFFTQRYMNKLAKFSIEDDGSNLSISNYSFVEDTTHFHRRDLTTAPVVYPNLTYGIGAYGGVFRPDEDLPYLNPILVDSGGVSTVRTDYEQVLSHYTVAHLPVYDSTLQNMHTVFFGGTSLNYYDDNTQSVVTDSLVPFIDDVSTLTVKANNTIEEALMPLEMPGLLGTNAKLIPVQNIPRFGNGVVNLRALTGRTLVGYIFGGIRAQQPNNGVSTANDTIYRVYLTPNYNISVPEQSSAFNYINIYPNPAKDITTLQYHLKHPQRVEVAVYDVRGRVVLKTSGNPQSSGIYRHVLHTNGLIPGIYSCVLQTASDQQSIKFSIFR